MTQPPVRDAVISVGTNSCRFLIASYPGDAPHPEYHETRGTRLGEGVQQRRHLEPAAVERTLDAVRAYATLAHGVRRTYGIGTSALRDAQDAAEFVRRFAEIAGTQLEILSGEEEARCSFAGALCGLASAGRPVPDAVTVIDVGGGSTEFATRSSPTDEPAVASLQMGAVRLTELHLHSDPPSTAEIEHCRSVVRVTLRGLPAAAAPRGMLVGVGGTANTAARMLQLMDERVGVAEIPAADLSDLLKATISVPVRERLRMRGLPQQRADIFPAGLMILAEAVSSAGARSLVVSESDLLLGYLARHRLPNPI